MLHVYVLLMRLSNGNLLSQTAKTSHAQLHWTYIQSLTSQVLNAFVLGSPAKFIAIFSSACQQLSLQLNKRMGKLFSLSFLGLHHLIHHLLIAPFIGEKKNLLPFSQLLFSSGQLPLLYLCIAAIERYTNSFFTTEIGYKCWVLFTHLPLGIID